MFSKYDLFALISILLLCSTDGYTRSIFRSERVDTIIPSYSTDLGNGFNLEFKMTISLGTHGRGLGFNAITSYVGKLGSMSAGLGTTYYLSAPGTALSGFDVRIFGGGTADLGKGHGLGYYHTKFLSGQTSQHTGNIIYSYKDWSFSFENDYLGDLGDRYRSHASVLRYKDMSMGLNLFSGDQGKNRDLRRIDEDGGKFGTYLISQAADDPDEYRLGLLYISYKIFRIGTNSEYVRYWTQNRMIHDTTLTPHFTMRDRKWNLYGGIYTFNPFTSW